jgi:hypothetical protein
MPDWPRERRELPAHLLRQAARNADGYVYEIDGSVGTNPDGYVPFEAIIGAFPIGPDGIATGDFIRNPERGPVQDVRSAATRD